MKGGNEALHPFGCPADDLGIRGAGEPYLSSNIETLEALVRVSIAAPDPSGKVVLSHPQRLLDDLSDHRGPQLKALAGLTGSTGKEITVIERLLPHGLGLPEIWCPDNTAGSLVSQPPFSSLSRDPALSETPIPSSDLSSSHLVATALRGPFGQEHHTLITTVR